MAAYSQRQPVPMNPDAIRGMSSTQPCTDIIAPELMDVTEVTTYDFLLYRAPTAGVNNPERGYAVHYQESVPFVISEPARKGFLGRLVSRRTTA